MINKYIDIFIKNGYNMSENKEEHCINWKLFLKENNFQLDEEIIDFLSSFTFEFTNEAYIFKTINLHPLSSGKYIEVGHILNKKNLDYYYPMLVKGGFSDYIPIFSYSEGSFSAISPEGKIYLFEIHEYVGHLEGEEDLEFRFLLSESLFELIKTIHKL